MALTRRYRGTGSEHQLKSILAGVPRLGVVSVGPVAQHLMLNTNLIYDFDHIDLDILFSLGLRFLHLLHSLSLELALPPAPGGGEARSSFFRAASFRMGAGQNASNATTSDITPESVEIAQPSWEVRLALGCVFGKWMVRRVN